jgi:Ni2+-binding GTPase involved in maturation of urease and hydrogenase
VDARGDIESVRPGIEIVKLSAKTGEGIDAYLDLSQSRRAAMSRA